MLQKRLPLIFIFVLALFVVFLTSGLILAFTASNETDIITPTLLPTSPATDRPGLAPPATREGVMNSTPDFATFVPLPVTTNFDAAQVAQGREIYTMRCATCHGDRGQGLALWRSSWDADHQNCTKSGCHGANHPPDGFAMPQVPPPLIGPSSLTAFQTAAQLQLFIASSMPYQAPGVLAQDEYWALTAFLADQHQANAGGTTLNDTTAANVILHPAG